MGTGNLPPCQFFELNMVEVENLSDFTHSKHIQETMLDLDLAIAIRKGISYFQVCFLLNSIHLLKPVLLIFHVWILLRLYRKL